MMTKFYILICLVISISILSGQATLTVDGYVFESGNRGFLNVVEVKILDSNKTLLGQGFSDPTGHFEIDVPVHKSYTILTAKDAFEVLETAISSDGKAAGEKVFVKIEMKRAPGYTFEITLAERKEEDIIPVDAIKGARIEVYNNTTKKEHLLLLDHPDPHFKTALLKGNHYTILVRKEGYLSKRMEAFVDVKGCILCFEGIGSVNPGVADNLSEGNQMGVLLANVELDRIYEGKTMPISNILYEYTKADINKKDQDGLLDLATLMRDNPDLTVEIGSHTDSRGKMEANMDLSYKRAKNVVEFLTNHGVNRERLVSRGYGETKLLNGCTSFIECPEAKHRVNRRTELKILGIASVKTPIKSLFNIKRMEQALAEMESLEFGGGQVKVPEVEKVEDVKNTVKETTDSNKLSTRELKDAIQNNVKKVEVPDVETPKVETPKVEMPGGDLSDVSKTVEKIVPKVAEVKNTQESIMSKMVESKIVNEAKEVIVEEVQDVPSQSETIEPVVNAMSTDEVGIKSNMVDSKIVNEAKEVIVKEVQDVPSPGEKNEPAMDAMSTDEVAFRVAIKETTVALPMEHELYQRHSSLKEFRSNDGYIYTISSFKSMKAVTEFFEGAVQLAYPEARIVKEQGGMEVE